MGLDDEDTPVGEIIALSLMTLTVFIVIAITFDSCTNFERDARYEYCSVGRYELGAVLGHETICYDDDGNIVFQFTNTGEIEYNGIKIDYPNINDNKHVQINISRNVEMLSSINVRANLGLMAGQEFMYINVTPLTFFEEENTTISCNRLTRKIKRITKCKP